MGRRKFLPRFRRFTSHAFEKATFGKYDPIGISRWKSALIYLPLLLVGLWFAYESITALNIFQP